MDESASGKIPTLKKSIILLIAFIVVEKIVENGILVPLLIKSPFSELFSNILYKAIEILLVLSLNYFLTKQAMHFKFKITLKQAVFLILSIAYLAIIIRGGTKKYLFGTLVWALLTAVSEELLFRGVILGNLLNFIFKWTVPNRKKIFGTVLLASFVFSLEHLTNLMNQSMLITICQLIQTFGMGVLLAAVYIRTGSLVDAINLHFLIDFPGLYFSQFSESQSGSSSQVSIIGSIIVSVIYIIIAIALAKSFSEKNKLIKITYKDPIVR